MNKLKNQNSTKVLCKMTHKCISLILCKFTFRIDKYKFTENIKTNIKKANQCTVSKANWSIYTIIYVY